jgi:hypothetical protein
MRLREGRRVFVLEVLAGLVREEKRQESVGIVKQLNNKKMKEVKIKVKKEVMKPSPKVKGGSKKMTVKTKRGC